MVISQPNSIRTEQWYHCFTLADHGRKFALGLVLIASIVASATPATAQDPLLTVISVGEQTVSVFGPNGLVSRSGVSTGKSGHPTPTGFFSILQKNRFHESNIYSGASMPYMQRLTWSGIALHQGHLPGYPASHGCIRLSGGFAQQLWGLTRVGNRVIVAPGRTEIVSVSHPQLPVAMLHKAPASAFASGDDGAPQPGRRNSMLHQISTLPAPSPSTDRLLNPVEFAHALRASLQRQAVAAAAEVQSALAASAERSAIARQARANVEWHKREIVRLANALHGVGRLADLGTHRSSLEETIAAGADLEHEIEDLEDRLAYAIAEDELRNDEAFAAAAAARDAQKRVDDLAADIRAAARRLEPISVLVSRKEGRVFIRQGFVPLLDAPVAIRDADRPLGSHLLMAMKADRASPGSLQWTAATPAASSAGVSPQAALARIELPEEVRHLIAERLWIGGTMLITDFPVSNETGRGTDFVVLTR